MRLQRNALAVLEPPTGDESDSSDGGGDDDGGPGGVALPRVRARRPPRDYGGDGRHGAAPRRSGVRHPVGVPVSVWVGNQATIFCPWTKSLSFFTHQTFPPPTPPSQRINFTRLETAALKRYRSFYRLPEPGPNPSKEQLAAMVSRHFASYTVDESKVISMFVAAARRAAKGVAPVAE